MQPLLRVSLLVAALVSLLVAHPSVQRAMASPPAVPADDKIAALLTQLDDKDKARRDAAERNLVAAGLAATAADEFFARLPKPNDQMPQEMQTRLARIIREVQATRARQAMLETRLTLDVKEATLADVLADIEKQTHNRLIDYREDFGQEPVEKKITLQLTDKPFWEAADQLLDQAGLAPYAFAGEEALALTAREPTARPRVGGAVYSGPFRIEVTTAMAQRGYRTPSESGLRLELNIEWEPRLQPISLSLAAAELKVTTGDDQPIASQGEEMVFDAEIPSGTHAAEVAIPLALPDRKVGSLKSVRAKMGALVPARVVDLRFGDLASGKQATQQTGGVAVTLDRVTQNQAIWELHMRVSTQGVEQDAASNQAWVFQNVTYLENKRGERIDHAGFETTMQNDKESGFAYFFELPEEDPDIASYTWVYRTPAAIIVVPVEFELKDVALP